MAQKGININYTNIDTNRTKITDIITEVSTYTSTVKSAWGYLNGRVQNKIGSSFDCQKITDIQDKLEKIEDFLKEVLEVYQSADLDLSAELTMQYLEVVYPEFKNLSDERKAILLSAIRYLGLNGSQVEAYASNFKSQYQNSQFVGDTNHAWCAMFVGSIINYFYGSGNIIDKSYASVWKIIGDYNNQSGIAYETDPRIQYYLGGAATEKYLKYLNADGSCGLANWESLLNKYNQNHGTNIKVSDWVNQDYKPTPGDIITINMDLGVKGISKGDSLQTYNEKTDYNKRVYLNSNNGKDYPGGTSAYTHIAFVLGTREVDGVTYVDTIDGNYSNDVQIRSYRIDDPRIAGYGHIEYEQFTADQSAVQKALNAEVDTSRSHATITTASKSLLAFDPSTVKSSYLATKAYNVFSDGTTSQNFVRTLSKNTDSSTQNTAVQTSTGAQTTDSVATATSLVATDTSTTDTTTTTTTTTTTSTNSSNYTNYNNYSSSSSSGSSRTSTNNTETKPAPTEETKPVDETLSQEHLEKVIEEVESESASIFKRNNEIFEKLYNNKPTNETVEVKEPEPTVQETVAITQKPTEEVKPTEQVSSPEPELEPSTEVKEDTKVEVPEYKPENYDIEDKVVQTGENTVVIGSKDDNIQEYVPTVEEPVVDKQPVINNQVETTQSESSSILNNYHQETTTTVTEEPLNPRETETVQRPNEPAPVEETTKPETTVEPKTPTAVPTEESEPEMEDEFEYEEDYGDDDSYDEYLDDENFNDEYLDDEEYRNDEEIYTPKDSSLTQQQTETKPKDNKISAGAGLAIAGAGVAAVAAAGIAVGVSKKKKERG